MGRLRHPLRAVAGLGLFFSPAMLPGADGVTTAAWQRLKQRSAQTLEAVVRAPADLPPAAEGVVDLSFREFFAPAGDAGLNYSDRLRALAGKRVRLVGFMVRETGRAPGTFILSSQPVTVEKQGVCFVEDIPPTAVHVHLPSGQAATKVAYAPGRLALTGILEIGPRPEADGRNSAVRLRMESPAVGVVAVESPRAFVSPLP